MLLSHPQTRFCDPVLNMFAHSVLFYVGRVSRKIKIKSSEEEGKGEREVLAGTHSTATQFCQMFGGTVVEEKLLVLNISHSELGPRTRT